MRLYCDGRCVSEVLVADSFFARLRGMLGRRAAGTPLLIRSTNSVHSLGMRFPIDVGFIAADGRVVETVTLVPHRVLRSRHHARHVLEAAAGSFKNWGLMRDSQVDVRK